MSAPGPVSWASVAPKSLQMMSAGHEAAVKNTAPPAKQARPKRRSRTGLIMRPSMEHAPVHNKRPPSFPACLCGGGNCADPVTSWKQSRTKAQQESNRLKFSWINIKGRVALAALLWHFSASAQNPSQFAARTPPTWLRDGVLYEIFPRDFSAAGNLNGVTARLDELKDLGVTILWVMPIHPIGEKFRKGNFGSPYSISDYYAVDPNYGTLDDFKRLVAEAHRRGLKVIMDLVADHTSWDSVMMKHPEFYKQDTNGKIQPPVPEWTDVAGLNYQNPQLCDYMIAMMKYWVQTCDVDGFRCDVASMVPTDFWVQARAALDKVKPDIMMLAEANKPELLATAFDIDY